MYKNLIYLAIVILSTSSLHASQENETDDRIVGLNVYHSTSGSGYGSGLSLNIGIEKERRLLEAGIIFQHLTSRISGGEVIYKHFFSSHRGTTPHNPGHARNIRFYLQYNFMFRYSDLPDRMVTVPGQPVEQAVAGSRVATYEHYLGLGMQLMLLDHISLNTSLGYGACLGSIKDKYLDEAHYTDGGRKNDFGPSIKIGIGYSFF